MPQQYRQMAELTPDDVLTHLGTTVNGLDETEAARRLDRFGPNAVAEQARRGVLRQLLVHFWTPLNVMLLSLALASYFLSDPRAAVMIATIVVLSAGLSFVQEYRSNKAAEELRAMVRTTVAVFRSDVGQPNDRQTTAAISAPREIPIEKVVPGDVISLSAGDMVPADIRLINAKDVFANEATLTGEALPAEKSAKANGKDITAPLDLPNICFMGTNIVSGTATGVAIFTGSKTYFGQVADTVASQRAPTSFEKGVNRFVWLMIRFMVVMVPAVFLINGLTKGNWFEALLFAVAVAVGLTPEMLPMIVTMNLAKGSLAMSRKKVIVKRLNSIQNFGAMDVLCTDKTGTLTIDHVILEI